MLLQGKVVLVTGATGGFGTGLATTLVDHGAVLALVDVDAAELRAEADRLSELGAQVITVPVDLRDEKHAGAAVEHIKKELGRIDVLVNAAAVLRDGPLEHVTRDDWREMVEVNLRGTYVMCQEVGRIMLEQGGGAIINVTSIAAQLPAPNRSVYSITKAGIRALTAQIAVEWGPRNIRCNAVFFGGIPWTMKGYTVVPRGDVSLEGLPLRRLGRKDEFANVVVFLASDLASYVNGVELPVDGGRSLTLLAARSTSTPNALSVDVASP
jgi:NAD(P)-dependent dehydrogenase (short-subunit alcohol dehydrogenase family)